MFFKKHWAKITILVLVIALLTGAYVEYYHYYGLLPQNIYSLFQIAPQPNNKSVVVVFSPHEDDETLGAGGYIAAAVQAGAKVYIAFATDGNHMGLKLVRYKEAENSAAILGVPRQNVFFYNYPDTRLGQYQSPLDKSIYQTLTQLKPTLVLTTDPRDIHPDHHALGIAVEKELSVTHSKAQLYTFVIHYPAYPRPQSLQPDLHLLPPTALIQPGITWLVFPLTQDQFVKKERAILNYKSQLMTPLLRSLMMSFIKHNELFIKGPS